MDDASPADTPAVNDPAATAGASRRRRPVIWLAAAAVVAVLAGAGYGGWLLVQGHQSDVAAEQALTAAEKYALALTNIDPAALDKNFDDMNAGATGEFQGMHAKSRDQLRQLLIDQNAEAHGAIVDAAVKSATPTEVVVVVLVDQSVTNRDTPEPDVDRSRIRMTMDKIDGRWLASKVELL